MLGNIIYINDSIAHIESPSGTPVGENLMNMHVIFEDDKKKILGEVEDISKEIIKVRFLGEIVNNKFVGGVIRKPSLSAALRIISNEEVKLLVGDSTESITLGVSPLYDNYPITVDVMNCLVITWLYSVTQEVVNHMVLLEYYKMFLKARILFLINQTF